MLFRWYPLGEVDIWMRSLCHPTTPSTNTCSSVRPNTSLMGEVMRWPMGAWQLLPYKVPWVPYLGVLWAWTERTTPAKWVAAGVTLIYKKGLATEAAKYRPIFVNPLMYLVFMKVVYWRYAPLIMDSLDVYLYAVRGSTTFMKIFNLVHAVTALKSRRKDGCICKLDISKAFPGVPHVLFYHMMGRMGWSTSLPRAF